MPYHCPGCGTELVSSGRYPWHLCGDCLNSAVDATGRRIGFMDASMSGGLVWLYADEPDLADDTCHVVYGIVGTLPVMVREARFGGVVAQPVPDPEEVDPGPPTVAWLASDGPARARACARLKPFKRTS